MTSAPLLSMQGISKRFGSLAALDDVSFDVVRGEIHAIVGENGAGKSTLMNCLFGLVEADAGTVLLGGEPLEIKGPKDALERGIGMVHQHFKLVSDLTVTENIYLGREIRRPFGFVDGRAQRARVTELSARFGLDVDPDARIRDLSVGAQQRVEILRSLLTDARILILDEPTAVLTPHEAQSLFQTLREVVDAGLGVVFITHRLDELMQVADRVTVLRHGRRVAVESVADVDSHILAELIVGGTVPNDDLTPATVATPGADVLQVEGLRMMMNRGVESREPVDLTVRAGEIVGLVGIPGNGQSELVEAITGLRRPIAGTVKLNGVPISGDGPGPGRGAGLAHIAEDRNTRGISLYSTVAENLLLGYLDDLSLGTVFLRRGAVRDLAAELVRRYDVRVAHVDVLARRLSGGNAQKVVVARELSRHPAAVVACEPVRGLDIAATRFVYDQLVEHRDAGAAVLLVSTELKDVLALADRLLVMSGGRIVAEYSDDRPDELEISKLMLGSSAA